MGRTAETRVTGSCGVVQKGNVMLQLDGSRGEGGGQILRTSLSLSLLTRTPFRISRIRAGRAKPGLLRQHLTAVQAAAEIGGAETSGAELHSQELVFRPRTLCGGTHWFDIGTAGSTTLIMQTLLPVLAAADVSSRLVLRGGTHNPFAPPFEALADSWLPLFRRMGAEVELKLERPGFFPAGGGQIEADIQPLVQLQPLELLERGDLLTTSVTATVARLPAHVGRRELRTVSRELRIPPSRQHLVEESRSAGPGNIVQVRVETGELTEIFSECGSRGVPAEKVAGKAAAEAADYLAADVPVGAHLADQLLLPLALAGGGAFRTLEPTQHTLTNAEVIGLFLDVPIRIALESAAGTTSGTTYRVTLGSAVNNLDETGAGSGGEAEESVS